MQEMLAEIRYSVITASDVSKHNPSAIRSDGSQVHLPLRDAAYSCKALNSDPNPTFSRLLKKGARVVAVLLVISTAINIVFSLTRTSTVAVYTLMT
ncbi:hypothetical protein ANCDUO_07473 [Ancylostoma duodenale]|uniref:Uncharacterized protein n=1 Tax=Ancylostoma duodenale TaxID=51022 RepID=A0A0C2GLZ2_9BILA|nr:hypothetical protein ANCDUO_07473 [Ancylostoma duodenale]